MDKKKILVIEDEIIIAENTKSMLVDLGYEVVGHAMNIAAAKEFIDSTPFDVALVDLMLGNKKDGVEIARILKNKKIPFIITSSYSDAETLNEIKELMPSGYIVKPIDERDLYAAIEIIPAKGNDDGVKLLNDSIFYKDKDLFVRLKTNDVEYIKTDGNYLEVYVKEKKHVLRLTMEDFLDQLPNNFIRVHRSYAINCNHISAVNSSYVKIGTIEIPLSKTYRESLLKKMDLLKL